VHQRTLSAGIKAGISTGAGASTVQVAYASVVLLGLQQLGPILAGCRPIMSTISAGLMVFFAWRILRRKPSASSGLDAGSVLRNYGSAVAFNCLNPMLLVLWSAPSALLSGQSRHSVQRSRWRSLECPSGLLDGGSLLVP
jgi:threonine/homoserine/homoserine lactone efflux protein